MKLLITLSIVSLSFLASANSEFGIEKQDNTSFELYIGADRGKKSRKSKRINKKRKRKCAKWSRKGYAG